MSILRNASDAYVSEANPSGNFSKRRRLYLADASASNTRYAFLYWGLPSGLVGSNVINAKVQISSGTGFAGSVTMSLQRLVAKFSVNRINWNNRPGVTGAAVDVVKVGAADQALWEFDVTALLQQVADGGAWYGFRVASTNSTAKYIYSAQARDDLRPVLVITYTDAPEPPDGLKPDDGKATSLAKPTLRWNFSDVAGDTTQTSFKLRLFSTLALANTNGVGDLLDATIASTIPSFDLDTPLTRTATVGTTNLSPNITGTFTAVDVGETITGAGIPGGATIVSQTGAAAVMSANATATASVSATIGVNYAGLAADATVWWRVQVTDGSGLTSGWSDVASFSRTTKGTLTITNPAVAPNDFVSESTPPFSWTFTVRTQEIYEVILTTPETPETPIWTSGKITSTDTAVTPPINKIKKLDKVYRLIVRIWDTIDRQAVPDDTRYVEASRDFTYKQDATVAIVTGLTSSVDSIRPTITFTFQSATAPDEFVLYRDGDEINSFFPVDVLVSGTTYSVKDRKASPRQEHTWKIGRKVNNKVSSGNPSVVGFVRPVTTFLSDTDGNDEIFLFNPEVGAARAEDSEIQYLLGDAPPVLITQSIRGYEGSVTGMLLNDVVSGLSADTQLSRLKYFKRRPGIVLQLTWVSRSMEVVISNVSDAPIANVDGSVEHLVSFDFFQVD